MDLSMKSTLTSESSMETDSAKPTLPLPTIKRQPICRTMMPHPSHHRVQASTPKLFRPWEVSPVKQPPVAHERKTPSPILPVAMTMVPVSSLGYRMHDPNLRMCLGATISPCQQPSPWRQMSPNDSGYQSTSPQGYYGNLGQSPMCGQQGGQDRRTMKFLNARAVQLMEMWYRDNVDHPYPSGSVVDYLATHGDVTRNQVKKWMSNKRVRCANTLPFKNKWMANQKRNLSARFLDPAADNKSSEDSEEDKPTSRLFSRTATYVLNQWFEENKTSPYPTDSEKERLSEQSGLTVKQVRYWFANKRSRSWGKKGQDQDVTPSPLRAGPIPQPFYMQ